MTGHNHLNIALRPISEQVITREAYTVSYDMRHRQARWVYERLTREAVEGNVARNLFSFMKDPSVKQGFQSTNEDYLGSGFDRGHLSPAADARSSVQAMKETFYLSNISPQCPQFNRGYWARLEKHVRNLTKDHAELHVFTGPLYLPHEEADGKRYITYQVIGENDVAVPTHYFKVIFNENMTLLEAFIVPNQSIPLTTKFEQFTATIEKVEKAAGISFLSR